MPTTQMPEKQPSAHLHAVPENGKEVRMEDIRICFPEAEAEIFQKIRQLEADIAGILYQYAQKVHALEHKR